MSKTKTVTVGELLARPEVQAYLNGRRSGSVGGDASLPGSTLVEYLRHLDRSRAVPVVDDIDRRIVRTILEQRGGLRMYTWHVCETTHCRAGWATTLAGKAGIKLENDSHAEAAGMLIYAASRPGEPIPDFFATDDEALGDLIACAGGV
jgi:hypothetical protein